MQTFYIKYKTTLLGLRCFEDPPLKIRIFRINNLE